MVRELTAIFNQAYRDGCVPTGICPIYTENGDFLRCENYSATSLKKDWDHGNMDSGKELEQCNMIWVLRLVIEKHWEYNQPLFIASLDLEKPLTECPERNCGWRWRNTWYRLASLPADLQIATNAHTKPTRAG